MKIKPLGFYILIEMEIVENLSTGGIVIPENLIAKEQDATSTGYVRAIGPTAFFGYPGCEAPENWALEYLNWIFEYIFWVKKTIKWIPAYSWGLHVGQKIEYRKFEGKTSSIKDYENYRYIPDSHIIGAINDE